MNHEMNAWEKRAQRWTTDTYGFICNPRGQRMRRHPKCGCPVACQRRFSCRHPSHRGPRATPWCNGAADEHINWCDTCFARHDAKQHKGISPAAPGDDNEGKGNG